MSWGALPFWVYDAIYEHDLAKMQCCFEDEWFAGTHKQLPEHVISISKATFKTHDVGGWNHERVLCGL
jgi:hypothetical protein